MRHGLKSGLIGAVLAAMVGLPVAGFAQEGEVGDEEAPQGAEAEVAEVEEEAEAVETDELEEAIGDEEPAEAEAEDGRDWSVSASLTTRVGQGTFVKQTPDTELGRELGAAEAFANRVVNAYSLSPSYTLGDFTLSGDFSFTHWLTRGGGTSTVPYSSNATKPNEFRMSDIGVSASWAGYEIEPIEARVSGSASVYFPTSRVSRTENLIATNIVGASLSRTFFDKLNLRYGMSGLWLPHTTTSPTIPTDVDTVFRTGTLIVDATSDLAGNGEAKIAGYNIEWGMSHSLSASIPIWEDLSFSASYAFSKYWTYNIDNDDQFAADTVDENGDRIVDTGRASSNVAGTTLTLSYPVHEYLSVSGGLYTRGPVKTRDNKSFRFPFWNFNGAANNFSAVQLTLSTRY